MRTSGRAGAGSGSVERMAETQINPTAAALLGLLHDGPMTGGQLMSAAERRLGPYWSMTRSQVYRELPALADQGFVRLGKPGPRASQPYAITAAGKRAFGRWLAEPTGRDALRNPVALRVAFGEQQSATQLRNLYAGANEYHTEALASVRERVKDAKKAGDTYGASALEFAAAYHRAALSWLKSVPSA
jgi:DNA-binding PadR family transcriptional regulator